MTPPTAHRIPIGRKLLGIQALLFGVILAIGAFTFVVLERVVEATDRVGTRYAPQSDRMAAMQVLMFRISLEARHAMLVTTPEAKAQTFERIGQFRRELLAQVDAFERDITTDRGRAFIAEWRKRDAVFWRLGGEVLAKVQAGDNAAAFAQLEGELVGARNAVLEIIDAQRAFQSELMLSAVSEAEADARRAEVVVPVLALLGLAVAAWMSWRLASMMRGAFRRAQLVTQLLGRFRQRAADVPQPVRRGQRVAVAHLPERTHRTLEPAGQRRPEPGQGVDLPRGGLAKLAVDRREVVAPYGRRSGCDGAGRPLGRVVHVARDAMLGRDVRTDHLQRVELRGHLERGARKLRIPMQGTRVTVQAADARPGAAARQPCRSRCPQGAQSRGVELSDAVPQSVDGRHQVPALHGQPCARGLVAVFTETGEPLEPVHSHSSSRVRQPRRRAVVAPRSPTPEIGDEPGTEQRGRSGHENVAVRGGPLGLDQPPGDPSALQERCVLRIDVEPPLAHR